MSDLWDVADIGLADAGEERIAWAERESPVLCMIRDRFLSERPFDGLTVAACLQVTAETAVLTRALRCGGAQVWLAASNPLSTQDDVAAALAASGSAAVFARQGVDIDTYYRHIRQVIGAQPDLVIDDGGDLVDLLHAERPDCLTRVIAGCEFTASGITRMRRMAAAGVLAFPVAGLGETQLMRVVGNTCATGQSVIDGIVRATNMLIAGATVVVAGFGPCGQGIASRARGFGAEVIITETDPVRALSAVMQGYRVLPMLAAAPFGDLFITATGSRDVISKDELTLMRDGVILANAGHFDVEIDIRALADAADAVRHHVRPHTDEYVLAGGRRLRLLAEGRVVNLVAAEGHPASVMDLSFACQALALAWLAANATSLEPAVHEVPAAIEVEVANLKLAALGLEIDASTPAQQDYLSSWGRDGH